MQRYFEWFGLKGSLVLTSLLSASALALALIFPSKARWLCFAAMLLSSAGDIFLMHFRAIERNIPHYFEIGAVCFMIAHVLYAACFAVKIRGAGYPLFNPGAAIALLVAAACLIGFMSACKNRSQLPLAVVYLAIITLNCMCVFSYAWSRGTTGGLLAAVGALSFLVSDLIIGLGMLVNINRYDEMIWWFYPIGQALLIVGAGL